MISNLENLTDLFDEFYIVQETVFQPVKEKENTPKVNLDGKQEAELLFIFPTRLQGVDAEMIHKLVHNAMKLNRETVSFMYLSENQNLAFDDLIKITPIKKVLVWGAEQWIENILDAYQTMVYQGVSSLWVEAPAVYHDNVEQKTKLWNAIQQLMKT